MSVFENPRIVPLIRPQAVVNNAAIPGSNSLSSPATVDTLGYDAMKIDVVLGTTAAALTVLQLLRSDNGSDYVASTAHTYGGSGLPALPGAGDGSKQYGFEVDLRAFPYRYWRIQATVANGAPGAFLTATAHLTRADESPNTDAERGFAAIIKPA